MGHGAEVVDQDEGLKACGIRGPGHGDLPRKVGVDQTIALEISGDGHDGIAKRHPRVTSRHLLKVTAQDVGQRSVVAAAQHQHVLHALPVKGPTHARVRATDIGHQTGTGACRNLHQ